MKKLLPLALSLFALSAHGQHTLISADFEADVKDWLFTGFKYNYTDGFVWNSSLASPGSLVFYHGSGTGHWIAEDPLDPTNQVFYIDGFANMPQDNGARGMFFMKLDLTGGGAYTAGLVRVDYSFRMMRASTDPDAPTDWQIGWISWWDNPDNALLDVFYWQGRTVIDSFVTPGNRTTWTNVKGFFMADLARVDKSSMLNTGIHIFSTQPGKGFVSGETGLYYVDDILVTVSQGEIVEEPEPETWAGYTVDEASGNVDTGDWLGLLHVTPSPWVYSYSLGKWLFIDPSKISNSSGGWAFAPKY
jgi:hypothetical protein